jgi:hypothetical protein
MRELFGVEFVNGVPDGAPVGQIDASVAQDPRGWGDRAAHSAAPGRPGEPVVVLVLEVANHHAGFEQTIPVVVASYFDLKKG